MTGVEILSTEEVAIAWGGFNWAFFFGIMVISFVIAVVFGTIAALTGKDIILGVLIFGVIFTIGTLLFGVVVGLAEAPETECATEYKVTIDDSVSFVEFSEKYEIISKEGKIYTVREKE